MTELGFSRRPLRARQSGWARALARTLAGAGMTPDAISACGLGSSLIGGLCYPLAALHPEIRAPLLVGAAACIQLRLVCNLVDGMVAIEHRRAGPLGPLWNEVPDRVSDTVLLVGAGYGAAMMGFAWAEPVGWAAALFAVGSAYMRELGRALGFAPDFSGPGAKPQRMALLTLFTLLAVVDSLWGEPPGRALAAAVAIIAAVTAGTVALRLRTLARTMTTVAREPPDA